jgi:hypothetical protein
MKPIKKEELKDNCYYKGIHNEIFIALWEKSLDKFTYLSKDKNNSTILNYTSCFDETNPDEITFIPLFQIKEPNINVLKTNKFEIVV